MSASDGLTHFDERGASRMVDVGEKQVTRRAARATCQIQMLPTTLQRIKAGEFAKGNVLEVARLAGIMASKRTSDLIPLCHSLPLEAVEVDFDYLDQRTVLVTVDVRTTAKTGVEMEAMVAASTAALTIYDMCKSIDREMVIQAIQLMEKQGGSSGHFVRGGGSP